jgi:hypothetical protein
MMYSADDFYGDEITSPDDSEACAREGARRLHERAECNPDSCPDPSHDLRQFESDRDDARAEGWTVTR